MGGVGMGFTYSTTIACAQKWYPHKKGFITGIIVASLGFGGVVFTPIIESLIKSFGGEGVGEFNTFRVLAGIFLVVCSVGSIFMKNPPEGYMADNAASNAGTPAAAPSVTSFTSTEMLKKPEFYLVVGTFMLACMGGLMMIGFAKPIAVAKGLSSTATIGVLAISLFNSLGRMVWGAVSDKLGRKNTLIILLAGTAVLSLFVNMVTGYFIYVLIAFIGFFYGGFLSNFPTLTADLFGSKFMATNYGFVLVGFGIGAIAASQIAGHYKNVAASDISLMFPAFVIASCCAAGGIVMMLILKALSRRAKS
jgi:OFA family oxalate/formate antiporter-like MFS transporter